MGFELRHDAREVLGVMTRSRMLPNKTLDPASAAAALAAQQPIRRASSRCLATAVFLVAACTSTRPAALPGSGSPLPASVHAVSGQTVGSIEVRDQRLHALLDPAAPIEVLGTGFDWAEGPVWDRAQGALLFTDVPANTVYRHKDGEGVRVHLQPSGYTGAEPRAGGLGANGLAFDARGALLLCEHGNRRLGCFATDGAYTVLADRFDGRRFHSPNDLVVHSSGDVYFTDPPYGLPGGERDPSRELGFHGVFRLRTDGSVHLVSDRMSRPNGIALAPDERTLYVANSDRNEPVLLAFPLQSDGTAGEARVFFDARPLLQQGDRGSLDGLKVDVHGNVWATGPGGVLVLSPAGKHLGTVRTGVATANCAWGDDGSVLYLTADMHLLRVRTRTRGTGW